MSKVKWRAKLARCLPAIAVSILVAGPVQAEDVQTTVSRTNDLDPVSVSASDLVAQEEPVPAPTPNPQSPSQVTGVQLKPVPGGVEVILETTNSFEEVLTSSSDNSLITDIPNAQLRLPGGGAFRRDNPTQDIASVEVTNLDAKTIRVIVTGKAGVPTAEVSQSSQALILSVVAQSAPAQPTPAPTVPPAIPAPAEPQQPEAPAPAPQAGEEKPVEFDVVAEEEAGGNYNVPDATTATKTDTPIRDLPVSIQVVPQQVLEDRNVRTLTEAVETVSGVVAGGGPAGSPESSKIIRGFTQNGNFRNGYRDAPNVYILSSPIGVIEQVEVLKGPASVLFGDIEPGGIVNVTTKQPLREPFYNLEFEVGNRNFYWPSIDLSGPLTTDQNLLYRFIANYQTADGFQDFGNTNQVTAAPSITWKIGDNTELNLYYEYTQFTADPNSSYSLLLSDGSLTPRDLYTSYPNLNDANQSVQRFGYAFTHKFSSNWQVRSGFAGLISKVEETPVYPLSLEDDRFADIDAYDSDYSYDNYFGQIDVLGKFKTGLISHQLLFGFDINDFTDSYQGRSNFDLPPLDIQNPNYDVPEPIYEPNFDFENRVQSYGLYLQDQIALGESFKLLIGGRYDWVSSTLETIDFIASGNPTTDESAYDGAFSPRIGLVYQPSDTISLYASYSRSFRAQSGFASTALGFDPTRGTQYEVGIKADWLGSRLSTTLAAYHLTKTNVLTPDPNNPLFSIQTGEQRSQGIELDIAGEILPGWKAIASYAYTDAEVTKDEVFPVGNRLGNVPENQASLWTTYEIQSGNLQGLGFGLGLFYVGARQGDLDNSFEVGDYLRTDAAIYYRRGQFNAAINIRNLFDTDYVAFSDGPTFIGRGAPFTITGSISWEF